MTAFKHLPAQIADRLIGVRIAARRAMAGSLQGAHRSNRHGASVEFAEYRDYTPGDAPNLIDWSVYARTDRYLVRRFEEETNLVGTVLVDSSQSMAWRGLGPCTKLDYACSLAAAAMYVLVDQGDRAGLATFAATVIERHAAAGSASSLKPMLAALDLVAGRGRGDIGAALSAAAPTLPRRSLAIVISDCLQPPASVATGVRRLHHDGHDVRVWHVVDRGELTLAQTGLVEAVDAESGERIEVDCDELREAYRRAAAAHLDEIRRACLGAGADYRLVHTDTPIDSALRSMA
ncbi:MAG TPA: DUF58 domain-containing protein [Planctomycetota bacterium]|nr:DUF58 domain-containing protein [Planctomycetota bacterium]